MRVKMLAVFTSLFILLAGLFFYSPRQQKTIRLPFKCTYSTDYVFQQSKKILSMHVTHDLRLYDANSGYFLINGDAVIDNVTYQIRRSFKLKDIREKQGKTFQAKIVKAAPMMGDSIPDALFSPLIQEYQISNDKLQIDFFHLHFRSWLVSGPYAYISVCQRY